MEDVAGPVLLPVLRRVVRQGRRIDDDAEPERLHRLRIEVKRLRYQLEAFDRVYDDTLEPAQDALKKLQ